MKNVLVAIILLFIVWMMIVLNGCISTMPDVKYCYKVYIPGQVITFISYDDNVEIKDYTIMQIDSIIMVPIKWNNWGCKEFRNGGIK